MKSSQLERLERAVQQQGRREDFTDTELLDFLDGITEGRAGIIARDSTSGRGWRVHETSRAEGHNTVRAAITAYLLERLVKT